MDVLDRIQDVLNDEMEGKIAPFAEKAGIPPNTLSGYINKKRDPKFSIIIQISNTYDINLNWLATGRGCRKINRNRYIGKLERRVDMIKEKDKRTGPFFEKIIERMFPEFEEWLEKQKNGS